MGLKENLFRELLAAIEDRLEFISNGLKEPQSFDFKCSIDIQEVYNKLNSNNQYQLDDIKYCIALLKKFDYVDVSNGFINRITPNGYKFILSQLHGINCNY